MASEVGSICAIIPTYNNPDTVRRVVEGVRAHLQSVIVVDDGSAPAGRDAVAGLGRDGLAHSIHRHENGGKGAAVKTGLESARDLGFTHALQVDADGQHALEDVPRMLEASARNPEALVLAAPLFDESAPRVRRIARKITTFWTNLETGGRVIADPMCGFRIYPVRDALATQTRADAMDFDPEIAVRLVWAGVPVINVPTLVRYVAGGVSSFRPLRDNVLISWMHSRLMTRRCMSLVFGRRLLLPRTVPS
jgi:glycosyltransferase involved in cell wall biosynthesis